MQNLSQISISGELHYYPFGMIMDGRKYEADVYRFGFNGKENDNEVNGVDGGWQDYGMRMYDPRICRFPSVDPLTRDFPYLSPYQYASNNPVLNIDLDGLEGVTGTIKLNATSSTMISITGDVNIKVKVINLSKQTIEGFNFTSVEKYAESYVSSFLMGSTYSTISFYEYDMKDKAFNLKKPTDWLYVNSKLNVTTDVQFITSFNEVQSNDFVIAIVDDINYTWVATDGKTYNAGGLVECTGCYWGAIEASSYKDANMFVHELFHILGLDDIEDTNNKNNLMFHLGGGGTMLTPRDRQTVNANLFPTMYQLSLGDQNGTSFESPNQNTKYGLKNFLNNPKYKITFDQIKLPK